MRFRKGLTIVLVAVLILGTAAILWSFLSRSRSREEVPVGELLEPEISRASTDFDYSEYQGSERLFRVRSTSATLSADGIHHLAPVQLVLYDESASPADLVSSHEAIYEVEKRRVEFSGDVEIQLQEGTRIFSDQLNADLKSEHLRIEKGFRLLHGEVQGAGESLVYRIREKLMEVEGKVRFGVPSQTKRSDAGALGALYDLSGNRLILRDEAWIEADEFRLQADTMEIFLTEAKRIERIVARAKARFHSRDKSFSGQQINLFFQPEEKRLRYFEVLGGQGGGDGAISRATYRQDLGTGGHDLEADRIWGVPDPEAGLSGTLVIREFRAQENVRFRSSNLGIDESSAETLTANFAGDGNLRHLELRGGVSVLRKGENRQEHLFSRQLSLRYGPNQWLETVRAAGDVDLRIDEPLESQRLRAEEEVLFRYREGQISRIISRRARLESRDQAGRRTLYSPLIMAYYRGGLIERVVAQNGAEVDSEEGGAAQKTQSRTLTLAYEKGKMVRAVQSGDFRLLQSGPTSEATLEAQRAVFTPASQRTVVTGGAVRPRLRRSDKGGESEAVESDTFAERFEIDRATGRIKASEKVEALLDQAETPLRIWAGRMEFDPESGWIEYETNPRIEQGDNVITGGAVRLNPLDQEMLVQAGVESSFVMDDGGQQKRYHLKAERLHFRPSQRVALYEGDVLVSSEDFQLRAPWVELHFRGAAMDNLSEVRARGGVEVDESGRKALGEKAFYEPAEQKVRVLGNLAQVIDSRQGKAFGRQLTFYLGDDRLIVEGPVKP